MHALIFFPYKGELTLAVSTSRVKLRKTGGKRPRRQWFDVEKLQNLKVSSTFVLLTTYSLIRKMSTSSRSNGKQRISRPVKPAWLQDKGRRRNRPQQKLGNPLTPRET